MNLLKALKKLFFRNRKPQRIPRIRFAKAKYRPIDVIGRDFDHIWPRQLVRNSKYAVDLVFLIHGKPRHLPFLPEHTIQTVWGLEEPAFIVFRDSTWRSDDVQFLLKCLEKCPYYHGFVYHNGFSYVLKRKQSQEKAS